ncbi:MAG: chitobiase/beta-hexosaminidase C-terminal domain-containing protein [Verrucomicrobia bacterium]|nr:chitobiase/beta-hexosaminidase C-terminal domain-containing protein [Verrucomicrobiota bacterium]MCH8510044.1 hypothetical protein [Kiritimatiellia bacterium]
MKRQKFILGPLLTLWLAIISAYAQYPQGMGLDTVDVVTLGTDWLAIDNEGADNRGRVLHSTDNGETFSVIYEAPVAGDAFHTIATDGTTVVVSGADSVMRRTNFSVQPWVWEEGDVPGGVFGDIRDLAHLDGTWIGAGDTILRSTNGGETWTDVSPLTMILLNAVTDSNGSWVAVGGLFGAEGYRSTNDGATWQSVNFPVNTPPLRSVTADGFGNVLAVGEGGAVLLSTDNGQNFAVVDMGGASFSQDLNAVVATGENSWWIGGQERLLISLVGSNATVSLAEDTEVDVNGLWLNPEGELLLSGVEAVPPPEIDAETASSDPIEVTLIAVDSEDDLFYSVDGSDPRDPDTRQTYAGPFVVTGSVTVQAVAARGGVYSQLVSREIEAGELQIFSLDIALDNNTLMITQDSSSTGISYQLQGTTNLSDPESWQNQDDPKSGTGAPLQWIIDPIPPGTQAWRTRVVP